MSAGVHPWSPFHRRHDHHTGDHDFHQRHASMFGRFARGVGEAVGVLLLFVVCLVGAVLIHLRMQVGLRVVAARVNAILADSFQGKVEIRHLGAIGPFGLSGVDATIYDPAGQQVLDVHGVRVRVATIAAARSALFGKPGPIVVGVREASVRDLNVSLDTDAAGQMKLMNALAPRHPSPPPDPNARALRVDASRVSLGHAWAHGQMGSGEPLDVQLDDLAAWATYAPDLLEADVSHGNIVAHRIARGLDVGGALLAHLKKSGDALSRMAGRVDWKGTIGTSAHTLTASLEDQRVDATLEAPQIATADLQELLPGGAFTEPGVLRLSAHGTLPALAVDLRTAVGPSSFRLHGDLKIAEDKSAALAFEGSDLDAHVFSASAPGSRLGLRGDVAATMAADGRLHGDLAMRFLGGHFGERVLPTASIRASATRAAPEDLRGDAEIVIDEPAAPTRATADWALLARSSTVDFTLDSNAPDLDRLPELGGLLHGGVRLAAKGSVDLKRASLDARVDADAHDIGQGSNGARAAKVAARVYGPFAHPGADVAVHAQDLTAGPARFSALDVTAAGLVRSPHVTIHGKGVDTPSVDGSVDLSLEHGMQASDLKLSLFRAGEHALLSAQRIVSGASGVRVDGARIEGLGDPATVAVETTPAGMRVRAEASQIDLSRIGRLTHSTKLRQGKLALDADLDLR
ncbi:MAG: hypothetical protein JOZ69_05715, partial [Myxococcales bacterium]|nr:hypothetical protein [Myxococcales bacterium]